MSKPIRESRIAHNFKLPETEPMRSFFKKGRKLIIYTDVQLDPCVPDYSKEASQRLNDEGRRLLSIHYPEYDEVVFVPFPEDEDQIYHCESKPLVEIV